MYGNTEAVSIGANSVGMPLTKAPQAPCDGAIQRALKCQDTSMALLDQLEARLSSVLRDNPPGEADCSPEEAPQSQLHRQLLNIGSTGDRVNSRINDIIGRLTV